MKRVRGDPTLSAPEVTATQIAELKAKLTAASHEPLRPTGTVGKCPNCGGRMLTTNDLQRTVAVPGVVFVVTRLPGAECSSCTSTELDGAGAAILESAAPRGLWADYETAVTHASGSTLGTYFKMDLARVLGLTGEERLSWKVVDHDRALVQVRRDSESPTGRTSSGNRRGPMTTRSRAKSRRREGPIEA